MTDHRTCMTRALELAREALNRDEFPVGCILVRRGRVIASGARTGTLRPVPSELDHAEILALRALEALGESSDRGDITLYSTLEPCMMCYGAILLSKIGTLVYAYEDAMGGCTGFDRAALASLYRDNPLRVVAGIQRAESLALFKDFFSRPHLDYWRGSRLAEYTLTQP